MSFHVFNKENHTYWLGDKQLPSVTQILSPLSDFDKIPKDVLKHKGDLGTEFHNIIHLYLKDDLVESSIDDRLVLPFDAFKKWSASEIDNLRGGLIEHR
ncbi:MAG: hypothetical protein GY941_00575, partial [Planctomycetes bacterium]|nr:hypothetical protein [Planctomycetota bacterium]